ncbi:alpha/beta fold hydrolase [Novosphingobium sp. BL-52-GroH]|uniref:alpha/beta fold hydrolase n=1 Tax=Novosphingobium sp. BL-52-GroH TaxID=3349877 RepID=UPI00384E1D00
MSSQKSGEQRRTVLGLGLCAAAAATFPAAAVAAPRRRAAVRPATSRSGWVKANGQSVRYETTGSGPAVILLHEIGMALQSWDLVLPQLPAGHQYIRYDLRGFGLSQKIDAPVSFDDLVADLAGLLDALRLAGPVTLVGCALGGAIALAFAATYPTRVAGIVSLAPAAGPRGRGAAMLAQADLVERTKMSEMGPRMAEKQFAAPDANPAGRQIFEGLQISNDPRSAAALVRAIASVNFDPIPAKVRASTLFVAAGHDSDSQQTIDRLAAGMRSVRVTSLPCGHFMPVEMPDQVAALITAFLRRNR